MLFSKRQKAGYVKIEDSHFALLKQNSKDQWEYKTVFVKPGINETWKALVREIRHFFPKNTRLNFIFSGNSGFTVQYFPAQSEPAEIKNSIYLNFSL
ncbi:MAG: hypothetical protein GX221_04260 [Candidatus Riflebacteria bacterium]|nr:hypothetical protein [Candidatus Riflebacteria bacterium]